MSPAPVSISRPLAALLLGLTLLACKHRRGDGLALPACAEGSGARDANEAADACLEVGDRLYRERARTPRLDEAVSAYSSAQTLAPERPDVLFRVTRAHLARAYGNPVASAVDYRLAREAGLRCLLGQADVAGAVDAAGGVFTERAAAAVDAEHYDCLLWTAASWSRAIQDQGLEGATLDQPVLVAMGERALKLSRGQDSGPASAALGLALALPPAPLAPQLDAAEWRLKQAITGSPGALTPKVDLAVLVYGRRGDTERWRALLEEVVAAEVTDRDPDSLENRRAIQRAQLALAAGVPDGASWWRR